MQQSQVSFFHRVTPFLRMTNIGYCSHPSQTLAVWLRATDKKQLVYKPQIYNLPLTCVLPSPAGRFNCKTPSLL